MNSVRVRGMKPELLERLQKRAKIDSLFLQVQLFPDMVPMGPYRAGRRVEHVGNFFGSLALADQIGDLNFLGVRLLCKDRKFFMKGDTISFRLLSRTFRYCL